MTRRHGGRLVSTKKRHRARRLWLQHGMPGWKWRYIIFHPPNWSDEEVLLNESS